MDLKSLDFAQLQQLQKDLIAEMAVRREEVRQAAVDQIRKIAEEAGISLKELANPKMSRSSGIKGTRSPAQYVHPTNVQLQWTGRGRPPGWVKEWLASGQALEGLRVKS